MDTATGTLYLIPSVIAEDTAEQVLSPQIREVMRHTTYFLVENVRTARRFISSLQMGIVIDSLHFELLTKDSSVAEVQAALAPLKKGENIGVLSEAGCPGIADPGALAAQVAHDFKAKVVPLVGPSAIFLTLMASGMSGQQFAFHGYLPIDAKERTQAIKQLEQESGRKKQAQLFIETPYRNQKLLDDLIQTLQPGTRLCIGKNLTAADEEVISKPIAAWRKEKTVLDKVPVVFIFQA
ncbi:SAM-dependent methyltransferase [Cytophagales bacterium LB-30]|uniref:SAM-dependent methyltransferase n=1 Tax=Shiella aurantiaca TaxID=3058365 RepID=A0ABT8F281_9BACT|nr:SAM-dependent methyltransferase [Shiella aurantiaca]MDN4164563.1 SAM-dependent methyltransferase [Shiella aurantiaca]